MNKKIIVLDHSGKQIKEGDFLAYTEAPRNEEPFYDYADSLMAFEGIDFSEKTDPRIIFKTHYSNVSPIPYKTKYRHWDSEIESLSLSVYEKVETEEDIKFILKGYYSVPSYLVEDELEDFFKKLRESNS